MSILDGADGPTLIKVFSCENCRFLGQAASSLSNLTYKCLHNDVIKGNKSKYSMILGNIGKDKITPDFCPYIFKKERYEKLIQLKEINDDVN